jgi:hypothetical protein
MAEVRLYPYGTTPMTHCTCLRRLELHAVPDRTLHVERLIARVLIVLFFICTYDHNSPVVASTELLARGNEDVLEYDIIQRTCALEVVLVVRDREDLRSAARLHDADPVPVELRSSGTMLACMPQHAE